MIPRLTDEMRQALAAQLGGPISICDDQSQQFYVLVPQRQYAELHDDYVRRELQVAFDQADRGEWVDLDVESIIAEARRRHGSPSPDSSV